MSKGKIIVISGPTGSGESAITRRILQMFSGMERIITVTSRSPRPYEKDGVDYVFVSPDKFHQMAEQGEFLEYIKVPNREVYYGTLRKPIEGKLAQGIHLVGNLGWPGHQSLAKEFPGRVVSIFIKPDSLSVIRDRLIKRDPTITPAEVAKRLQNAQREIDEAKHYDYVVVNPDGQMERAVAEVRSIIQRFLGAE